MITLNFDVFGKAEYTQGEKSVTVVIVYRGSKKIYKVWYYNNEINRYQIERGLIPNCCRPMTEARTEKGALKEIRRFFNE
jgi:hypothetical protein